MDNSGKIIWASHNDIQTANIKTVMGIFFFFFFFFFIFGFNNLEYISKLF